MKKSKPLIVILIILVLCFLGWAGYLLFQSKRVEDVFLLVPAEASMVIEINDVKGFYKKSSDQKMVNGLMAIPSIHRWMDRFGDLAVLLDSTTFSDALLQGQSVYCSLHGSASKELGAVWYVPFENDTWEEKVLMYIKSHATQGNYLFEQRHYEGYPVYDLMNKTTKETFSFTWYQNVLVGSYTGYLVEDVVRLVRTQHENHFMSAFEAQRQSRKIHYDDGNVFVNFARMPQLLGCFASDSTTTLVQGISSFAEIGVYDLTLDQKKWLFHGYTHHKAGVGNYSSVFEGQVPQTFTLHEYVPMNTSLCYFWGIDKSKDWFRKWEQYNVLEVKEYLNTLKDWEVQHHLGIEHEFIGIMGNEMALLSFPMVSTTEPLERVLLMKTKNQVVALEKLNEWRVRNKSIQSDLYSEYYDGHKIHQWGVAHLPYWLCGDMAKGFDEVYYTFVQDVLVMGNSLNAMKNIIKSYNNQDVWRRNVGMISRWKDLTASNFSMFIQPQAVKSTLIQQGLNSNYANTLQQYDQQYNLLKSIVVQFAFTQDKLYTNAIVEHDFSATVRTERNTLDALSQGVSVPTDVDLYAVSVSDNWSDVFYVDSTHALCLINTKGQKAWSFQAGGKLQTQIASGDFNKDGSSDYIFIAANKIHALSNKGQELDGFPMQLSDTLKPEHLVVIDYDLTKNYRLSITDAYGKVFLLDMKGNALEGWSSKDFGTKLYLPATHLRVGTNDRIIGYNAKGDFYCFNRRAEIQPGFPLSTGQLTISTSFVNKGTKLSDTYVYTISDKGLKCKFNLEGKLESKVELPRTLPTGKFMLVKVLNSTRKFYMVNWDQSAAQLLDESGAPLFRIQGSFSNNLKVNTVVQDDVTLVLFQDKATGLQRVYDQKGTLLHEASGKGNNLSLITRKDQSGWGAYLLEVKGGQMRWLKIGKAVEEIL